MLLSLGILLPIAAFLGAIRSSQPAPGLCEHPAAGLWITSSAVAPGVTNSPAALRMQINGWEWVLAGYFQVRPPSTYEDFARSTSTSRSRAAASI